LKKEVREGRFRADLYHRLSVFTIAMPALREIGNDSICLLRTLPRGLCRAGQPATLRSSATTAAERLLAYGFPGNVRELRNIAIRLTTKFAGQEVGVGELEAELDPGNAPQPAGVLPVPTSASRAELVAIALGDIQQPPRVQPRRHPAALGMRLTSKPHSKLAHDNMSQAARLLGVNRTTLYNRIEMLERVTSAPNRTQRPD
jgi:DNA-binding NtrC family response regulator